MKELLLSAIKVRQRLIRSNKSYIRGTEIEQFCRNLRYWIESGADIEQLANRWDREILTVIPNNFINKYNTLKRKAEQL